MNGCLSTEDMNPESLVSKAKAWHGLVGWDLVQRVTCPNPYAWQHQENNNADPKYRVVALDFGIKYNILRQLTEHGCEVQVVPAKTTTEEILSAEPDGVFLSNGPGDPMPVGYAIETIQGLMGKKPLFGICLGHQLLGLALGGKTFKLKFGHRGTNQPVKHLETDRVEITSQNHGFALTLTRYQTVLTLHMLT